LSALDLVHFTLHTGAGVDSVVYIHRMDPFYLNNQQSLWQRTDDQK
jgi:hypothetical protein